MSGGGTGRGYGARWTCTEAAMLRLPLLICAACLLDAGKCVHACAL